MSLKKFKLIQYPSCKVCFKKFEQINNKPTTIMPCCHTFCSRCIDCLTDKKCPICRITIRDRSINWELLSLLPDNDPSQTNSAQFFKFENEPQNVLLSEANKSIESINDFIKLSAKNSLDGSKQLKERFNNKIEELQNKIVFSQHLVMKRIEKIEINYNDRIKQIAAGEKDLVVRVKKVNKNDLDELVTITKEAQQFIKSINQLNSDFEFELNRIENEDFLNDFKWTQFKTNEKTKNQNKTSQNGVYHYVLKCRENLDHGLTIDEKFFIKTIDFDSPAYKTGLKENYKIVEINGIATRNNSYFDMVSLLNNFNNITFSVIRFKRITVRIPNTMTSFGISISLVKDHNFKSVIKVEPNSPAFFKGLKENDVIFEINGLNVKHLDMNQIKAILTISLKKKEAEFLVLNHDDFNALILDDFYFD